MATTSNTNSVALDRPVNGRGPLITPRHIFILIAVCALLVVSWRYAELRPEVLFQPATAAALWNFARNLFHPDLSPDFLLTVLRAVGQTLAIAVAGTLLSIAFGLPLGVLATATLWNRGVLVAEHDRLALWIGLAASRMSRTLLGFLRAVPDLVWALLFVAAVGLGSIAGTLAVAVSYCGVLGRIYADVFEHIDPQPLEALQSTGATRLQIFLRGIWPQALPHLTAYTLYSFECCVRAAAVLGFVGAGGIGYEINISMRMFEYGQVMTLILAFIVLLIGTDSLSRYLRARTTNRNVSRSGIDNLRRHNARNLRPLRWSTASLIAIASFAFAGFSPTLLTQHGIFASTANFIRRMFPLDLSWTFVSGLGTALLQTIAISLLGTLIGIAFATLLALPATSTLILIGNDSPGRQGIANHTLRWLIFWSARLLLNILRSIPELVWVLICILAVGIGPFAGTIALGLHTTGVLGKLYAETMEEVSPRPLEALRSVGASPMQVLLWAIWPQARPLLSSYTVLRWETNLRASTILGLVGGGGLGQAIYNNVQLGFYSRLSTLILVIYALVLATDWMGERLRLRVA